MDFWIAHGMGGGLVFLLCLLLFPRLTLLVATSWGGCLWWAGLALAPRLTAAIVGTTLYWDTNPVLCVLGWLFALTGEGGEKSTAHSRAQEKEHVEA